MSKTIPVFAATVSAVTLALALLVTSVSIRAQPAHATATAYTHTDLGALADVGLAPGNTIARGVNTSGQVVGHSPQRQEDGRLQLRAFYWDGGPMSGLGTLGGPTSAARGINDSGQVVGSSRVFATGTQQEAFVAKKNAAGAMQMSPLGTLPEFPSSEAFAINETGQIVGRSSNNASPPGGPPISSGRAFLYQDGEMKDLGALRNESLQEDPYSEAWAINDSGQVVGESGADEDHGEAFLYSGGSVKGLGTLKDGTGQDYPYSEAFGINDSGQIVGWSYTSRTSVQGRAFLYREGEMKDLGTLKDDTYSMARAIDENGRVVGQSRDASGQNRAFLWENGEMMDLNLRVTSSVVASGDPPLKRLLDAYAISESGQIVGSALNTNDKVRAFLLTPNDTTNPHTMATISPEPNAAGWNKEDVTITLDATDEGGSNVKKTTYSAAGAQPIEDQTMPGDTTQIKIAAEGVTTLTYYATDHAGNAEGPKTLTVRLDKTKSGVDITSPANGEEYELGESVIADYACSDGGSGVDSCAGSVPIDGNVDTASIGQKTFTVEAEDFAGNVASKSHTYNVIYDFDGFYSPIDNPDVLNRARAGSAIPVRFSLDGDQGLDIFAEEGGSSFPRSGPIPCDSTNPVDAVEQTVSANSNGLTYDAATDLYTYVWKTRRDWTGCRQLVVRFDDGKEYTANFKFTR